MKKNILLTLGIIILIALIVLIWVLIGKQNKKDEPKLPPITIALNVSDTKRDILVEDNENITKLNNYLNEIKTEEKIDSNLALMKEVVIIYENNEEVVIQTSVTDNCYYKSGEELKLVKMPDGLLSTVAELITNQ